MVFINGFVVAKTVFAITKIRLTYDENFVSKLN